MNKIKSIAIDKLTAHPGNANRMSRANFAKLVRNIEQTGRYEPLIVRPEPKRGGLFQIINGHHRCRVLKKLGYTAADCLVWDVDDEQTDILLATLNRLSGADEPVKKIELIKRLNAKLNTKQLAKLLPYPEKQIQRLVCLERSGAAVLKDIETKAQAFAEPLVFFVSASQRLIIEQALALAAENVNEKTGPARRAEALCAIAKRFVENPVNYE